MSNRNSIWTRIFGNQNNQNRQQRKEHRLTLENLEERALLSVSPYHAPSDDNTDDTPTALVQPLTDQQPTVGETALEVDFSTQNALNADISLYNEHDVACLRNFLEQTDSSGKKNGTKLNSNYNADDPSTWKGVTWSEDSSNKQVTKIDWYYKSLVGSLDVSGCTALTKLSCGTNKLTSLDVSGCTALTSLSCYNNPLTSLDVSNNTALTELYCYSNQLTSLDVSNNTALTTLSCGDNQLTSLDVSNNTALTVLSCSSNQFTSLDVSNNTTLKYLYCDSNQLTSLDVSNNTALTDLDCDSNQLTSLSLSNNTALKTLRCWNEALSTVALPQTAVSNNLKIYMYGASDAWTYKNAEGTVLESDVTSGYYDYYTLTELPCVAVNQTTKQDIQFNSLTQLSAPVLNEPTVEGTTVSVSWGEVENASSYQLEYKLSTETDWTVTTVSGTSTTFTGTEGSTYNIRVKALGEASYLDSEYSNVQNVTLVNIPDGYNEHDYLALRNFLEQTDSDGVKNGTKINSDYNADDPSTWTGVTWSDNTSNKQVTGIFWYEKSLYGSLDVSGCTALTYLGCLSNELTSLDVSGCTALTTLLCYENQLTSLDVSNNTALTTLSCGDNQLTSLDVSKNTALTKLSCYSNQLTSLDVSKNTALTTLWCQYNQLTSLDVSNNTALTSLSCDYNQLTSLDVSNNTDLTELFCHENQLPSLDVSNNTALTGLYCGSNQLTSLDVSNNTALTELYCYSNQLTSLDVSKNTALTKLSCYSNQLTSLDVSKNTALIKLYCWNNALSTVVLPQTAISNVLYIYMDGASGYWTYKNAEGTVLKSDVSSNYYYIPTKLPCVAVHQSTGQEIRFAESFVQWLAPVLAEPTVDGTTVSVSWSEVENVSSYQLEYKLSTETDWTVIIVTGTSTTFTGTEGSTYNIRVKALGEASYLDSEYSNLQKVNIPVLYNKHDYLALRNFLEQTDSDGVKNGTKINSNYNADDPSTWSSVTWSDSTYNKQITEIYWYNKSLVGNLDVSDSTALTTLYCNDNQLTSLDVSGCTALTKLYCENNQLTSLVVSNNTALTTLYCWSNQLPSLDVSGCTALTKLDCENNQLTSLVVSGCTALIELDCRSNQLTSLAVSGCSVLKELYCYNNKFTSLDLSNNTTLTKLGCSSIPLTSLNVSGCIALIELSCYSNQLTSLNVSGCTALTELSCYSNKLTSLNVSGCTALTALSCYDNQLTSLNVSGCTALTDLDCYDNQLTSLDLSSCTALKTLKCYSNQLTFLDLLNCTALTSLECWNETLSAVLLNQTAVNNNLSISMYGASGAWTYKNAEGTVLKSNVTSGYRDYYTLTELPCTAVNKNTSQKVRFAESVTMLSTPVLDEPKMLSISWGAVENASGYQLEYKMSIAKNWTVTTVTGTSTTFAGIEGFAYNVRIKALGEASYLDSEYSDVQNFTVYNTSADYNIHDYLAIRNFLEQTDIAGVKNGTKLSSNYSIDDPSTWLGVTWSDGTYNKQITKIVWQYYSLAGSLDLSDCTALTELNCYYNQLTSLDISGCTALTSLECYSNQLPSLDVTNNTALTKLDCNSNQLTSLDVSKNTALTKLDCDNNQLTSLDVSNNTVLTELLCEHNQLTSLDVTNNTALTKLNCRNNQLTSLDVSKNTVLTELLCEYNQLTSLDVSKNTALTWLWCYFNQLTSLDVSNNTALTRLACDSNQLTSLDVSKNTALTDMSCSRNQLTSLDVSKNTALTKLSCCSNQLPSLDLSKNTALTSLKCWNEALSTVALPQTAVSNNLYISMPGSSGAWTYKNAEGTVLKSDVGSSDDYTLTELPCTAVNQETEQEIQFNSLTQLSAQVLAEPTVEGTTVSVSWNEVENASGYQLEYRLSTETDWTVIIVTGTSTTFTGTEGSTYNIRVKALGEVSYLDSEYSSTKDVTIPIGVCDTQKVYSTDQVVISGSQISVPVYYEVSDGNGELLGLGLRIHYDSSKLTYTGVSDLESKGAMSTELQIKADTNDYDGDLSTDKVLIISWVDISGTWPGSASELLMNLQFEVNEQVSEATSINFTSSCTTEGYDFVGQSANIDIVQNPIYDIDGDGQVKLFTDGMLFSRYISGYTGDALIKQVVSKTATRTTADEISSYLNRVKQYFDIDGDGEVQLFTDGMLLNRYLSEYTDDMLIKQAVSSTATRTTADAISQYIEQYIVVPNLTPDVVAEETTPVSESSELPIPVESAPVAQTVNSVLETPETEVESKMIQTQSALPNELDSMEQVPSVMINNSSVEMSSSTRVTDSIFANWNEFAQDEQDDSIDFVIEATLKSSLL